MDPETAAYIDAIDPVQRPSYDRVHELIVAEFPGVEVGWSYKMPTYIAGDRRLHVAMWKHGLSLYGWDADRNAAFVAAHPELKEHKGTIRLRPRDLDALTDDDLRTLIHGALDP